MNDSELLELAAKAAGIEYGADRTECSLSLTENGRHRSLPQWNPLTDDGDAFRLAVRLHIDINSDDPTDGWVTCMYQGEAYDSPDICEPFEQNPLAATRRAIVRAAAEIGRAMP